jgi:alcohol dehydrogenase class IV
MCFDHWRLIFTRNMIQDIFFLSTPSFHCILSRRLFKYRAMHTLCPSANAYASLSLFGQNIGGGLGLSHRLGYALVSPYGIPHGLTSCMTLGPVGKLQARQDKSSAESIAAILPYISETRPGNDLEDSDLVGDRTLQLVQQIGLKSDLTSANANNYQIDIICARATRLEAGGKTTEERQFWNSVGDLVALW